MPAIIPNSNRCLSTTTTHYRSSYPTEYESEQYQHPVCRHGRCQALFRDPFGRPFPPLANNAQGHTQLLKLLRAYPKVQVVCEATGDMNSLSSTPPHAADILVSIIEAGRVRYFARAQGQRSKNPVRLMPLCSPNMAWPFNRLRRRQPHPNSSN